MQEQDFLQLAQALGLKPLRHRDGGWLIARATTQQASEFPASIVRSSYWPEGWSKPNVVACELVWYPPRSPPAQPAA